MFYLAFWQLFSGAWNTTTRHQQKGIEKRQMTFRDREIKETIPMNATSSICIINISLRSNRSKQILSSGRSRYTKIT